MKRLLLLMLLLTTGLAAQSTGHWIVISHGVVGWHATVPQAADPFQEQINAWQQRADEEFELYRALLELRSEDPARFDAIFGAHGLAVNVPQPAQSMERTER